ncbi:glycosyltransferase [Agromyces soli]
MSPRVTALLVVQHGGDRLSRALDALRSQRLAPDRLVVVLTQATAEAREAALAAAPDGLVQLEDRVPFGEAVRRAEQTLPEPSGDDDAIWLLSEDTAPAPTALVELVTALETAKSVAIAGPKLLDAEAPDRIVGLGRSMTRFGAAVPLVSGELDQGQHDGLSDVLGVDPAGLLVRRPVWRAIAGFDPGLPVVDDGLDLAVRARLAGHRVAVVPTAHVRFEAGGLIGPAAGFRASAVRRRAAAARRAALHRRMVYAPAAVVPLHWLTLLPLALVRSVVALVTKAPGRIVGEFGAALRTMFGFGGIARSRGVLKRGRTVGWAAIAPLRVQPDEMRRRRRLEAEERRARARGRADEVEFLATGGGWVLLVSVVASIALFSWLLGSGGVSGGALLPLSPTLDELWRNAAYGWRDLGAGFVGAADPFQAVLAVIGSLAFWSPSYGMLLLWLAALPVAALGAWFAASRLTERGSLRALAAFAWMLAPPLLTALADGRPSAVFAHVLLGWLLFAGLGAATSWATAAGASLLFAGVLAAAPSLAPALLVAWAAAMAFAGRGAARLALLPVPFAALVLPLVVAQFSAGNPFGLLADPGVPFGRTPPGVPALALGFADAAFGGWSGVLASLGASVDAVWVVAALVAPLALAAVAAFAAGRLRAALLALGAAALGFATAVAAGLISVAIVGDRVVPLDPGPGQSLMWLGLIAAAVVALDGLRRGAAVLAGVVGLAATVAVAPLAVSLATGQTTVRPAAQRSLPAFVTAEAETDPRVATLRLVPQPDGGVQATLEHGEGATLDDQSTFSQTRPVLSDDEIALAQIAGNLASQGAFDANQAIEEFGISYVLLGAAGDGAERAATMTEERVQAALDANAALVPVGDTDFGRLWRFAAAEPDAPAAQIPAKAGAPVAGWITAVQLVVFGAVLLLSIPAGVGREEPERRPRRRPVRRPARRERTAVDGDAGADVDDDRSDASAASVAEGVDDAADASSEGGSETTAGPGATGAGEAADPAADPAHAAGGMTGDAGEAPKAAAHEVPADETLRREGGDDAR